MKKIIKIVLKIFAWITILLLYGFLYCLMVILGSGCRVDVPKAKGYILTPSGLVDKNLLTKPERKEYKEWSKETYKEGKLKK